ncbi:two-component system sensor histidine kinase domain protein [Bacteroides fragilis str. 3998T(B)3]|uniref:Two-component system sensor histidine kinase domain protein n=1 Tax=Bacteroides fragilis str. 3998T(B)3 TaxID=1339316 RepID=A0A015XJJ0_BACFG|nr:two-component system sensor histidine kinase domain protein [Bacteroides fragilis str. 3998T(B)3]EXY97655.1 two-component system sensor histidine kinase domain protein [Bacteroides fragilis str. 3998 T(B) 4]
MKKELLLTILSSIALILLQVFWINSMYQKYENQYTEKINKAFLTLSKRK